MLESKASRRARKAASVSSIFQWILFDWIIIFRKNMWSGACSRISFQATCAFAVRRSLARVGIFFSSCRARSRLGRSSKRLVVGQLFSGCERTGEMQKARCLLNAETKQTPKHKHKPNTTRRKTSSKLSETLRFQKDEILGALSTSSRRHSDSRK